MGVLSPMTDVFRYLFRGPVYRPGQLLSPLCAVSIADSESHVSFSFLCVVRSAVSESQDV
jgi:hypothetical protein